MEPAVYSAERTNSIYESSRGARGGRIPPSIIIYKNKIMSENLKEKTVKYSMYSIIDSVSAYQFSPLIAEPF